MDIQSYKEIKIPAEPGVYLFKKGRRILYVGKATSLRTRTRSYFDARLFLTRSPLIEKMVAEADALEWQTTDSVLEALILEANLIKKHQPEANAIQKDDKSFLYVTISKDVFPQLTVERGHGMYGPFTSGGSLREALRLIRRIFPYGTHSLSKTPLDSPARPVQAKLQNMPKPRKARPSVVKPCFEYQIGLCPGTCVGVVSKSEYAKTIRKIKFLLEGKKGRVLGQLKMEMAVASKSQEYEKAAKIKRQIGALEHIRDTAMIKDESSVPLQTKNYKLKTVTRVEAYDIAHHAGAATVGVMIAIENGVARPSQYRKFKIKSTPAGTVHDIAHLEEVLRRRLGHAEWPLPQLIVVDGGEPQRRAAERVLALRGFNIDVAAVVKDERHKPRAVIAKKSIIRSHNAAILLANSEAHRFAIAFHRRKSREMLLRIKHKTQRTQKPN